MNKVTVKPSLKQKAFFLATQWLWWSLVTAWLVFALVWGGLHFVIVPRIAEFRPWLQAQASAQLGMAVRIDAMRAESNGVLPAIQLSGVHLLDARGQETLSFSSVLATVSVRSLLRLGVEQLFVHSPSLDLRRTPDGRIWIAGIEVPSGPSTDSASARWLLSQAEIVVHKGVVTWTDELHQLPPVTLRDVDIVLRKRFKTHSMRIEASPPADWGSRLQVVGNFKEPYLEADSKNWQTWKGRIYAQAPYLNWEAIRTATHAVPEIEQGQGALRAWVDVERAKLSNATADLGLQTLSLQTGTALETLALQRISGRIGIKALPDDGFEYFTQGLAFDTHDGIHWPGGNARLRWYQQKPHGEFEADRLDLAVLAQLAQRLPLEENLRAPLRQAAPTGLLEKINATWTGPLVHPSAWSTSGKVQNLSLAPWKYAGKTQPGVQGLHLDFESTQHHGQASASMKAGALWLPQLYADPKINIDSLAAQLRWQPLAEGLRVEVDKLQFANADLQGQAKLTWQSAQPLPSPTPSTATATATGPSAPRTSANRPASAGLPETLDLQGSISRLQLSALPRYLPLGIHQTLRDYLAQALQTGSASNVNFKVKGDLAKFPFTAPQSGDFRITADFDKLDYSYAPAQTLPKGSLPWPALAGLSGSLVIDRDTLQVQTTQGKLASKAGLEISSAKANLTQLYTDPQVNVTANLKGPLAAAIGTINESPIGTWTSQVLATSTATGNALYKLQLQLPLNALAKSKVQGTFTLAGNDLQLNPSTPKLERLRGTLAFTESSLSINGAQAHALGGDLRIDGGLNFATPVRSNATTLRIQGTASAEGLRLAKELGAIANLGRVANGVTNYNLQVGLRNGAPELQINSNLVGMALNLPAPLGKAAESPLPLRLDISPPRNSAAATTPTTPTTPTTSNTSNAATQAGEHTDLLNLEVGKSLRLSYLRDVSGPNTKVIKGAIHLGQSAATAPVLPPQGVVANIQLNQLDLDAWLAVLPQLGLIDTAAPASAPAQAPANTKADTANTPSTPSTAGNARPHADGKDYIPNRVEARIQDLTLQSRKLNDVTLSAAREGELWHANVSATQFNGYIEYRPSKGNVAGRVFARLGRLYIGPSAAQDVEDMLDQQPANIPALDIVIEDLELRGKKLGRLDIQAINVSPGAARDSVREWRLNRFNITTPEANLTASGRWFDPTPNAANTGKSRRRTNLQFKLDIHNSGDLLNRWGMVGVVAKGKGQVEGEIGWLGSPISFDFSSLTGNAHVNIENGQFLKADPGIAKLFGILSLQSLPRRLTLDFRDVFSEGFSFDYFRGDVTVAQGIAQTNNLQMKGVNATVMMDGRADLDKETQALKVVVIPEINAGSASLLASTINPLIGLTTFLAQAILRQPLIKANTQEFFIDGTWSDPRITKVERK